MITGHGAKLFMGPLEGMPVYVSEFALVKRWVYPVERFWTYVPSPETERWCRFFGFGHEVSEPGAYVIQDPRPRLVVHPALVKQLRGGTVEIPGVFHIEPRKAEGKP
jgi:hypothetical protein